ncbi:MAG: hypothetical protein ABWX59_06205 [Microbacteriaceae bacterium]
MPAVIGLRALSFAEVGRGVAGFDVEARPFVGDAAAVGAARFGVEQDVGDLLGRQMERKRA